MRGQITLRCIPMEEQYGSTGCGSSVERVAKGVGEDK